MKTSKINKIILVIGIIITLLAPNMCMAVEEITNGADKDTPLEEEKIEPSAEPSSENDADTEKDMEKDEQKGTTEDIEDTEDKDLPKEETEESSENTNKPEPATIEATQNPTKIAQPRESVITVAPGEGTLQDALSRAQDTDVIQLQRGRYTGEKIIINKSVTIRGVGASSGSGTSILPKIEIEAPTAETKVVLENFFIGSQQPPAEANYKFINIKTPVKIEMNNLATSFIGRGSDTDTNAITINMESESSGSTVNINNSTLYSAVNGIKVSSSNNNITLDKTFLYGKYAITFDKGGNSNTLTVKNGSTISGRSPGFYADEAIQIIEQNKLTINVEDSTIQGNDARGDGSTHIFSIDGNEPSKNVEINIEGQSKIKDVNPVKGSTIFNFGKKDSPANNNVIKVGRNVTFEPNMVSYKYNKNSDYVVVGIYDMFGAATIKTYNNGATLPEGDYDTTKSNWYKVTDVTGEFNIKNEPVTENMDLYPINEQSESIKVKIANEEGEYDLKSGETYAENADLQQKLNELKTQGDKKFSSFVTQDGNIIDENTKIYKDTTITPKYKVVVEIKNKGGTYDKYEIEEGQSLSYINQDQLKIYEEETAGGTKKFSRYREIGKNKYTSISKSIPITKNIQIEPVYYVAVTINVEEEEKTYNIDEGESLSSYFLNQSTLIEIKNFVNGPNKVFTNFVIENDGDTEASYDTEITKNTTLVAKYKIRVTVYNEDGETKEYLLNEGESLRSLGAAKIQEIEDFVKKDKVEYYINGKGEPVNFDDTFTENTKFEPVYRDTKVHITIKGKEGSYTLEEGENLATLSNIEEILNSLEVEGKDFSHFTYNDEKFELGTPIYHDMELTPVYTVTITVLPNNEKEKEFKVLEGTTFNNAEVQTQIEDFKTLENKHWEEFVDEGNKKIEDDHAFNSHTTIIPKYTITITVKTDADDEGTQINNIPENSTIEEIKDKLALYENVSDKQLARYENEKGLEVQRGEKLTENITIIPIYNVTVKIGGEDYVIQQNHSLGSLEEEDLKKIQEAIHDDNKTFSHFVNGDNEPIKFETPIEKNMELTPKYTIEVSVKINGEIVKKFDMAEGDKLTSKPDELTTFKGELATKKFNHFEDEQGKPVSEDKELTQNTTIIPKYDITITVKVNGEIAKEFDIPEGSTLENNEDLKEYKNLTNKHFVQFEDEQGGKVDEKQSLLKHTTIVPKYNIKIIVKVNGQMAKEFYIPEGSNLENNENLKEYKNLTNKHFVQFEYEQGGIIDEAQNLSENITIVPKYNVEVKIGNETYKVAEGTTLAQLKASNQGVTAQLESIKDLNKDFSRFVDERNNTIDDETVFNEDTTITAKYFVNVEVSKPDGTTESLKVEEGKTLNDLSEEDKSKLQEIKDNHGEGERFKEFRNVDTGEAITDTTQITEDVILEPVYEKIPETTNPTMLGETSGETSEEKGTDNGNVTAESTTPKTGDNLINFIIMALVGLVSIIVSIKLYKKNNK